MPRKRELAEKLYTGFERMIAPSTPPLTWNLFAVAAYRLLLGHEGTVPPGWEDSPRRVAELVHDPAATLPERLEALAYREIAGENTAADLHGLLSSLDAASQDVNAVLGGLACSMEGDQGARDRWFQLGLSYRYIETEQPYLFEMLSLVRSEPAEVDQAANAVALLLHRNFVGREPLTVAPLVCGLGSLARRAGTTARQLLHNRFAIIDDLLFAEGETPRLTSKKPELTPVSQEVCELRLAIRGDGMFDAGVDPAEALTRFLSETLTSLVLGMSRRREKIRGELESALDGGTCRTVVRLGRQVTLDQRNEQLLNRRISIAWECARHQLRGVTCADELHIERA